MKRWPLAILYWNWWYSVVLALRGGAAYGLQSAHWVVTASAVLTSTLAIELYTLTPRQYSRNFADEILTCIFTPWPVKRPFVCPSVRPSVRPERRYRLNSLNKECSYWPDYCLMHSTPGQYHPWSRLLFKMAMLGQFLRVSWKFSNFHDRLGPGLRNDVTAFTLRISAIGLKFGGMVLTMKQIAT